MSRLAIAGGTPVRTRPFPSWPVFDEAETQGLQQVLESGIWGGARGPLVERLEQQFAAFHAARYGIAVSNGTVSLELALQALGIGHGAEVIVPAYTFVATATAVLKVNAMPIFVDIDPQTYCIDPGAVEAAITPRTRAVMAVHLGGQPADMDRLRAIQAQYGIAVIEDAAQAHGACWKEQPVGALGALGSFSFQSSKNMSAGEGGMVLTNDPALAESVFSLHDCGRRAEGAWYEHHALGGNYRLTEFQSALLLAQLRRLPGHIERREASARYLDRALAHTACLRPVGRDQRCTTHAYHLYMMRYDAQSCGGLSRDDFVSTLRAEGIPAAPGYPIPLTRQPLFVRRAFDLRATGYDPGDPTTQFERLALPATERACSETVWLPQNVLLGEPADLDDILEAVRKIEAAAAGPAAR